MTPGSTEEAHSNHVAGHVNRTASTRRVLVVEIGMPLQSTRAAVKYTVPRPPSRGDPSVEVLPSNARLPCQLEPFIARKFEDWFCETRLIGPPELALLPVSMKRE